MGHLYHGYVSHNQRVIVSSKSLRSSSTVHRASEPKSVRLSVPIKDGYVHVCTFEELHRLTEEHLKSPTQASACVCISCFNRWFRISPKSASVEPMALAASLEFLSAKHSNWRLAMDRWTVSASAKHHRKVWAWYRFRYRISINHISYTYF